MAKQIDEACAHAHEQHAHHGQPKKTKYWSVWCDETGEQMEGDDDDLQVGKGAEFKNYTCVLTQKHIFDLKEPVEDSLKFIWEREAIEQHIRSHMRKGQRAENPASTRNAITLEELKVSRRVMRAAVKHKEEQGTQMEKETEIL